MISRPLLCPSCGSQGHPVKAVTVMALTNSSGDFANDKQYYLCKSPFCDVVYYGPRVFYTADLNVMVHFKENNPHAFVCYCRQISTADIRQHIAVDKCCHSWEEIKAHMDGDQEQQCLTKNPTGL